MEGVETSDDGTSEEEGGFREGWLAIAPQIAWAFLQLHHGMSSEFGGEVSFVRLPCLLLPVPIMTV